MKKLRWFLDVNHVRTVEESRDLQMELLEHLKMVSMIRPRKKKPDTRHPPPPPSPPLNVSATHPKTDQESKEDLSRFLQLVASKSLFGSGGLTLQILRVFRFLTRVQSNRVQVGRSSVLNVLNCLYSSVSNIRREASCVLRNLAYDDSHVTHLLSLAGIKPLIDLANSPMEAPDTRSASGATLQSISYRKQGRLTLIELGGVGLALKLVDNPYPNIRLRGVGILRNLTVDARIPSAVRESGIVPKIEALLTSKTPEEAEYAAGVLQNISREKRTRKLLMAGDTVSALGRLALSSAYVPAQATAVCALGNLLLPEAGAGYEGFRRKRLIKAILSDMLAVGVLGSALFDPDQWKSFSLTASNPHPSPVPSPSESKTTRASEPKQAGPSQPRQARPSEPRKATTEPEESPSEYKTTYPLQHEEARPSESNNTYAMEPKKVRSAEPKGNPNDETKSGRYSSSSTGCIRNRYSGGSPVRYNCVTPGYAWEDLGSRLEVERSGKKNVVVLKPLSRGDTYELDRDPAPRMGDTARTNSDEDY
ncbi:hypothetical protein AAMO2058_000716700 [Amorphochlora amoebiformis]